ncbi:hypothetical protein [Pseudozobellia thermophila]|uniref:Uncharacterized protein n=1 Tax=Pseudozobellia thermophila TaxID=192903 RepID=A0A1M6CVA2_9FLAO|nr:hypothetical protein [Pseudozobellia thermophila]SHI64658.1 hypothetical protein SAMN04488513_101881 [Pseudozobellia thermophila]
MKYPLLAIWVFFISQFSFGATHFWGILDQETFSDSLDKKSKIEITYPNSATVWTISEPARIEWKTTNIGPEKSIRFFLALNDMVVQELGTFKNSLSADDIALAKNIGTGDSYQVVGIELFPDNKHQIAKYATPYFSIRNPEADARKAAYEAKNRERPVQATAKKTPVEPAPQFDGRNISYVEEVAFDNEDITIEIWDHGRQDEDIVSIYLNGKTLISKHLLTYHRKRVTCTLEKGRPNDLFLYAHNLGKSPPNTVSVEISDGKTSEKIILNSDLKRCEAVKISVN